MDTGGERIRTKTVQIKYNNDLYTFQSHFIINFVLTELKITHGSGKFPARSISHFAMNFAIICVDRGKVGCPCFRVCAASTLHTSVPDPELAPSPVTQLQVRIQVARGAEKCPWSKDFSLDAVGYAGAIQIEHGGTAYHVRSSCCVNGTTIVQTTAATPFSECLQYFSYNFTKPVEESVYEDRAASDSGPCLMVMVSLALMLMLLFICC